jgi:hypothetical protein
MLSNSNSPVGDEDLAKLTEDLRKEKVETVWQLKRLRIEDWEKLSISSGLRVAIEFQAEHFIPDDSEEKGEDSPVNSPGEIESSCLFLIRSLHTLIFNGDQVVENDKSAKEALCKIGERDSLAAYELLRVAALLPGINTWYYMGLVNLCVFVLKPLYQIALVWHRVDPYGTTRLFQASVLIFCCFSAVFRCCALKFLGRKDGIANVVVKLSPKKKKQLSRDALLIFLLAAASIGTSVSAWLIPLVQTTSDSTVPIHTRAWICSLLIFDGIFLAPFFFFDTFTNMFVVRLCCIYNAAALETFSADVKTAFRTADWQKRLKDYERTLLGQLKTTRTWWANIAVVQLCAMLLQAALIFVNRVFVVRTYGDYFVVLDFMFVVTNTILMHLLLFWLAEVTDTADKELSQLAGPTAPPELQTYVSTLQRKDVVCMHILSIRWNFASMTRLLLGLAAAVAIVVFGWLLANHF